MPSKSTCVFPMLVDTLPFTSVRLTAVTGPTLVPKIEMISPGEIGPACSVAALKTVERTGGGGAVMVNVTVMVALGRPAEEIVAMPVYVFGVRVATTAGFRATVSV